MHSPPIRVLDDQTINKIAAGEVIENPASVVKELVENSLDAGASSICVEIQEGGRHLIRITDDGCGMAQDDALLCLERHATSKIKEVEDIETLLTMGFRGEAIPSIAAISKFTLLTSPKGEKTKEGTLLFVDGGRLVSCSSATRSPGTTIEVKSLFFNVPVRRKFQKSPSTDTQEILKMIGLLALGYPDIHFELIANQKTILKTPLSKNDENSLQLFNRIETVLGDEFALGLIPIRFQNDFYKIEGFIGAPSFHKPNRTGQHLFINRRSVFSPLIGIAVREGYGTMLPSLRYPLFVLHLTMKGSLVDVNVHPQKKEVRLRQENQLKELIIQAVQEALRREPRKLESASSMEVEPPPPFWSPNGAQFSPQSIFSKPSSEKWNYRQTTPKASYCIEEEHPVSVVPPPAYAKPKPFSYTTSLQPSENPIPKVIATLTGYCILDPFHLNQRLFSPLGEKKEGGLALLDQRAAHRRIHFEEFMKKNSTYESQSMLIPITLKVSPLEFKIMQEHVSYLNQIGFGVREFGDNSFLIDAYPLFLKQDQLQNFLTLLIQDLSENQTSRRVQMKKEEQLAMAASRASLPLTKQLSIEEGQALVKQLMMCTLPAQCPLGKPTCLYLTPEELAKWFQKA
jgi:DNA mismatch repair protein MutL